MTNGDAQNYVIGLCINAAIMNKEKVLMSCKIKDYIEVYVYYENLAACDDYIGFCINIFMV